MNDHRSTNLSSHSSSSSSSSSTTTVTKKMKKEKEKQEKITMLDESSILASIGSSLTNQNIYEAQVLREAKAVHSNGTTGIALPQLTGIGFPNLDSLSDITSAGGGAAGGVGTINSVNKRANNPNIISHMVTIFNKISNQLDDIESSSLSSSSRTIMENRSTNILRIQKQILLSYFAKFTNLQKEDIGFDPKYESKMEVRRKDRLCSIPHTGSTGSSIRTWNNRKNKILKNIRKEHSQNNNMMIDTHKLEDIKQNNLRDQDEEEDIYFDDLYDNDDNKNNNKYKTSITTVEILSKSKNASFGKQALESQQKSRMKSKQNMMSFKRKLVQDHGEEWVDPEILYQKRLERMKRRKEKRGRKGSIVGVQKQIRDCFLFNGCENTINNNYNNNNDNDNNNASSKNEIDTKKRKKIVGKKKMMIEHSQSTNKRRRINNDDQLDTNCNDANDRRIKQNNETTQIVSCPICNNDSIPVPRECLNDIDLFLSQHIQECTEGFNGGGGGATLRSSSRRSNLRRSTKQVNYKERDENEDEDEEVRESIIENCNEVDTQDKNTEANFVNDSDIGDEESDDEEVEDDLHVGNDIADNLQPNAIDDFDEDDYEDRVDHWILHGINNMREMAEQDSGEEKPGAVTFRGGLHIPGWINDRLFGYQRTALRWMWELHLQGAGGIVGDEMGLGKTVQVCSYLGCLASSRKMRSVLIIAPATMLNHWLNELSTWAPGIRRILMHKSGEKGNDTSNRIISRHLLRKLDKWLYRSRSDRLYEPIDEKDLSENDPDSFVGTGIAVLTTFESMRRYADEWVNYDWSYVVMDEGQMIRNPDADITISCKRLRTTNRLLLSGTPIQNDLRELWSLFDFVFPGRLGVLPTFLAEFADPIRRGGYSNASPMQVQLAYRCALVLRDLINPYLLRRQKKDIKEVSRMPGKTEQVLFCKLSRRQRKMYEAYLQSDEVQNILSNRGTMQTFRPIITLRKICNHPHLIVGSDPAAYDSFVKYGYIDNNSVDDYSSADDDFDLDEGTDEESIISSSGKLEVLSKILPLWKKQGHRVLIFSQWKKTLDIIQHFVNMQGWNFGRMDGNTNVAQRQKLVDNFNSNDAIFGMLLTTKTGGVGLNLIGANRVILFDPDWNPQSDAQARERAWRFGQKNPVTVYRLITAGTIEEKIYQRQIFKTAITNQILQDPRQRRMFSQKDLRDLFTLKPDSYDQSGDGVTETGELTKGRGVINIEDVNEDSSDVNEVTDNKNTLEEVLKSKGLAGIFDHDIVDKPFAKKSLTAQETEQLAKKAAKKAARILAESSQESQPFVPTWTGDSQRFGGVTNKSIVTRKSPFTTQLPSFDKGFGGARSAGINYSSSSGVGSSRDLLAGFRQRRQEIATGGRNKVLYGRDEENILILKRIKKFIEEHQQRVGQGPETKQLLQEFERDQVDAAIFKSLLKEIAMFSNGTWQLKK